MNLSEVPQACLPPLAQTLLAISPGVQVPGVEIEKHEISVEPAIVWLAQQVIP